MIAPISVRLDEDVRITLALKARREAIRRQTEAVGCYVAEKPAARAFYEVWGTPSTEVS